jgi:ankyrin repeat protein
MSSGDWKEMFDAAVEGNMAVLRYHLVAGVDANYQHPEYMCTPLVACILANQREAAKLLLEFGANPHLRAEIEAMTPLQAAYHVGNPDLIALIDPTQGFAPPPPLPARKRFFERWIS